MIPILHPFQLDACNKVRQAARDGARVIVLQSPTGSGKTTMAAELVGAAAAKGKRVLCICHRRRLVDQFGGRLHDFQIDHAVLMRGQRPSLANAVQVASRDTLLSRCMRNAFFGLPPADVVVVDEGRIACAPQMRELLQHYQQQGAYVILLDATPVTPDGKGLGPWAQALVVAARTPDLVRDGHLVPVRCYAPDRAVHHGKPKMRGIAGDLVSSWQRYAEGRPTILFTSRVQHSLEAVEAFTAARISAAHVDADTPDQARDDIFDGLESGRYLVISNVGIVRDGVDVPSLSVCQLWMEPPGRVAFLQACGRIMRPYPGKEYGILIDHGGAVFRHGFPDEHTEWTLTGCVDEAFKANRLKGKTADGRYCATCKLAYHGSDQCPLCGRIPAKPPRSVFKAPELHASDELLTEAERGGVSAVWQREERVKHWLRCVATAYHRDGAFGMAGVMFKKKYDVWPDNDFPCMPPDEGWGLQWKAKVRNVFPNFGKRRA